MKKFWIVWNPSSYIPPRFRHKDILLAEKEAKRLAMENPGETFMVMELKGVAACHYFSFASKNNPVELDEIPF